MGASLLQLLLFLFLAIAVIVILTVKYRVHAFFALFIACFIVGFGLHLSFAEMFNAMKEGFGKILQSLGFIIVFGTTLGVLLEKSGCTRVMADFILKKTGEKKAPLAMSITGFIVGLPIFCDSGYIVLSGLNQSLTKRTGASLVAMSISLATGLYAVHCLIPPHPGASAAAVTIGIDVGRLIIIGIGVALPAMIVGHVWSNFAGKKTASQSSVVQQVKYPQTTLPPFLAFLPVIVPILLIAGHSILVLSKFTGLVSKVLDVLGEPAVALVTGILLVFLITRKWAKRDVSVSLQEGVEKAAGILVIIGAGGAFGAVLAAGKITDHLGAVGNLAAMGLFFPFIVTSLLKTAQGSSTVAIITASSIVLPLLTVLHLDSDNGRLICVLAMGAGSMMISHANDAYFWVIAKFSGLDMKTMLKSYTVASVLMGLTTLFVVYMLSLVLL